MKVKSIDLYPLLINSVIVEKYFSLIL